MSSSVMKRNSSRDRSPTKIKPNNAKSRSRDSSAQKEILDETATQSLPGDSLGKKNLPEAQKPNPLKVGTKNAKKKEKENLEVEINHQDSSLTQPDDQKAFSEILKDEKEMTSSKNKFSTKSKSKNAINGSKNRSEDLSAHVDVQSEVSSKATLGDHQGKQTSKDRPKKKSTKPEIETEQTPSHLEDEGKIGNEDPASLPRGRLSSEKSLPKPKLNVRKATKSVSNEKKVKAVKDDFDDLFDAPNIMKNKKEIKSNKKSALLNSITDAANLNASLNNGDSDLENLLQFDNGNILGDDEVFVTDQLPSFAKSYILPKVMKKDSVDARLRKTDPTTTTTTEVQNGVDVEVKDDNKSLEAFKFSMLKASLDYESGFVGTAKIPPKPKQKPRGKKFSTGSSKERSEDVSGRTSSMSFNSNPMSLKKSKKASTSGGGVNCTGPGTIDQYAKYVKSGGFVPLPILDPERGVESSIFALHPGLDALDEDGVFTSSHMNKSHKTDPSSMDEAHTSIDQQFDFIRGKFGEPTIVIKTAEEEEQERQAMLQKLMQKFKTTSIVKRNKGDNLLDTEIPQTSSFESGYSTWLETSSVDTINDDTALKNILNMDQKEQLLGGQNSLLSFADKADTKTNKIIRDAMAGNNLLGMMEEPKDRYNKPKDEMAGTDTLDLFIDPIAIFGSDRHPALVAVLKQLDMSKKFRAEKLRLQEELFKMKSFRRDHEARREHLLNKAKVLQNRASKFKEKLADVWDQKYYEELEKTQPLEHVCAALREDLDLQHKKRMEALETKMKPIIVKDGPSKKANYKIMAARLHYDIYALTQRLRLASIRAEHEQTRREKREREVRHLRHLISEKKTTISTVTKGVPFSKIEVRPYDQMPNFSGPTDGDNPLLSGMPNAVMMAGARINSLSPILGAPSYPGMSGLPSQITTGLFPNVPLPRIGGRDLGQAPSYLAPTAGESNSSNSSSVPSSAATSGPKKKGTKASQLTNGNSLEAIQTT